MNKDSKMLAEAYEGVAVKKRKNTEQAPTPETDAQVFDAFDGQGGEAVMADFARQLERERNAARQRADLAVRAWKVAMKEVAKLKNKA